MFQLPKIPILVLATLTSTLIVDLPASLTSSHSAQAVQLRDGKTHFTQPPTLVDVETTVNIVYAWGATYYFKLKLPENSGEPMQRVTISQYEGGEKIGFDLQESFALMISPSGERKKLEVEITASDTNPKVFTIAFNPPIPPGNVIAIGLRPYSNPRHGGVFLFGVTAFPVGEPSQGQFLGYGRLQFYDGGHRSSVLWR